MLIFGVAACSGGGESNHRATTAASTGPSSGATTGSAPSTSPAPVAKSAPRWPLTGERRTGKLPNHPAYVVKVDNTTSSAPQLGLDHADMVVEELVEGGLTRLAAFFYSDIPDNVGPVRSMRASDVGIVEPANAFLVASGAADATKHVLNQTDINRVTEGARGFYRSSSRPAPYNLFIRLSALATNPSRAWKPPSVPYLPFGPAADFPGTEAAHTITATFSPGHTTDWRYTGGAWVRTNSNAESGHDFAVDNVLVLRVRLGDAGYRDPAGNPVPETKFYGSGQAVLVHGDQAVDAVWHKAGTQGAVTLTTHDGKQLTVPVGHTFIELVPNVGGQVSIG